MDSEERFDTALMVLSWIYAVVPGGGGVAATVASWQTQRQLDRLEATLGEFDRALQAVRQDVDEAFARGPDSTDIADRILESATEARNAAKRRYYAAAFAHALTHERPAESERTLMLDTLDQLQQPHLALLAALARHHNPPMYPDGYFREGTAAFALVRRFMPPGTSEDMLDRLWEDLANLRVLESAQVTRLAPARGQAAMDPVTPFGRRFIAFIRIDPGGIGSNER